MSVIKFFSWIKNRREGKFVDVSIEKSYGTINCTS